MNIQVQLLGPIRVIGRDGAAIVLPSASQRRLVSVLALRAGTFRRSHLADLLGISDGALRATVGRVRRLVGDTAIVTDADGYRLDAVSDAQRFSDLVGRTDLSGDGRLAVLDRALALWQGEALEEFRHETWAAPDVARLDEQHAAAIEDRAELLIAHRRGAEAIAQLTTHIANVPLRERPRGLLMLALARQGRQAEALRAFQDYRGYLASETGTEPSPAARSIEQDIAAGRIGPWASAAAGTATRSFIGRATETQRLDESLAAARRSTRQIVFVDGEMGLGKSTLIDRFVGAIGPGPLVAKGRCIDARTVTEPYGPILEALDRLAAADGGRVVGALRRYAPTWLAQLPWLHEADDRRETGDAMQLTTRSRMLRELARLIETLASQQPLILLLEDLHWADPATLDAIDVLAQRDEPCKLLLLASYRRSDAVAAGHSLVPLVARLAARSAAQRIDLQPLDGPQTTELVLARLGGGSLDGPADEALRDWTGGNPLCVVTAVDHLVNGGRLARDSSRAWRLSGGRGARDDMPPTLQELISDRLERLDPAALDLLETASLIDSPVRTTVLADVLRAEAPEVDERCAALTRTTPFLMRVDDPDERSTEPSYAFTHAAFASALHRRVAQARSSELHLRIGERLEADHAGRRQRVDRRTIAEHLRLGGAPSRATPHYLSAAWASRRRFAHRDALHLFERALETNEAAATDERNSALELEARMGLALEQLFLRSEETGDSRSNIDQLHELVDSLGEDPAWFAVWQNTLLIDNLAGRAERVRELAPRLLRMAEARGRAEELMDAHHSMGEAALHSGRPRLALEHFDRAAEHLEQLPDDGSRSRSLWRRDSGSRICTAQAGAALIVGDLERVQPAITQGLELCEDGLNTPLVRVGNFSIGAATAWLLGDLGLAARAAARCIEIAEPENEDFRAVAQTVLWATGSSATTADLRTAARTLLDRPAVPFPLGPLVMLGADLLAPQPALAMADELDEICTRSGTHWADAELQRIRGVLLRRLGRRAESATALATAIELAGSQGAGFFLARAHASAMGEPDSPRG